MHSHEPHRSRLRRVVPALAVATTLALTAAPAGAQYGGGANLFVDPVEVEIDGVFSYFGDGCPPGSTVQISVDGFPVILDTTVAADDSGYLGFGVDLPDGVVAGTDYRVEANCLGITNWAIITAVCNGGTFPVNGECPDGHTMGGQDPTTATTTSVPGSGGSGGTTGGSNPDLAVTGATAAEKATQLGATLIALGGIVLLVVRRRRDDEPATLPVR